VSVMGVNTMYTDTAHYGIGSGTANLREPKIAVLSEGGSQTDYGAIWWNLERRFGIKFTPIPTSSLAGDLSAYNVIIAPAIFGLSKDGVERVKSWIQSGGTLITMGSATAWASREDVGLTSARLIGSDPKDTTVKTPTSVPGALFATQMNRDHWLTYGFEQKNPIAVVEGSLFLKATKDGSNVVTFPKNGEIMRGGFAWPDQTEKLLRGTALVIDERIGGGHAVLFTNDPMFRAWWRAFDHMILNAIILGPAM
jgi:hypothetical protein